MWLNVGPRGSAIVHLDTENGLNSTNAVASNGLITAVGQSIYMPNESENDGMKFEKVDFYSHRDDPALKGVFALENLFLGKKTMDLLIIYMFLKGYSNSTITDKLFLTPQALNSHKNNYFKKVGCSDKADFIKTVSQYVSIKHLEEYIQYISEDFTDFSNY
jgi:DNA-binding NarL/FixJ family response regulator